VPTKTYTREVITLFTKDELAQLLREAHEYCKREVKPTYHHVGKTRKRAIIARPRGAYQDCIKRYINQKIQEKIGAVAG